MSEKPASDDQGAEGITEKMAEGDAQPRPTETVSESKRDAQPEQRPDSLAEIKEEGQEYISGVKLWLVMFSVTFACFLMLLDLTIVATAIPRITSEFHSLPDVGWYASAYQLTAASIQPLSGKIYTYFKTKWVFICFLAVFEIGSLVCGLATSSTMLIIGRAVAGMGAAGIQNGTLIILAASTPIEKRTLLTGILFGFAQLGIALGPLVGGALSEYSTWRWCFYLNLPAGALVTALIVFIHIPDQVVKPPFRTSVRKSLQTLDLIGFVLFTGLTIQFLLALQWGGINHAWNSAIIIGLFCGSGGTLLAFLGWDYYKGDDALIPFSMLRRRVVWCSALVTLCAMSVIVCNGYFFSIYFQAVLGLSPLMSGVSYLPSIWAQIFTAIVGGFVVNKLGRYLPPALLGTALHLTGNALGTTLSPTTPRANWVGYQLLLGGGRGLVMQAPIIAVQFVLPASQLAIAMSLLAVGQSLGGAVFVAVANAAFGQALRADMPAGVDVEAVIVAGAAEFRGVVPEGLLEGVLRAWAAGVDRVFVMTAVLAGVMVVAALGMGFNDVRKKVGAPAEGTAGVKEGA